MGAAACSLACCAGTPLVRVQGDTTRLRAGGDLYEALKHSGGQVSERRAVRDVIRPCLSALIYLHAKVAPAAPATRLSASAPCRAPDTLPPRRGSSTGTSRCVPLPCRLVGAACPCSLACALCCVGVRCAVAQIGVRCAAGEHPADGGSGREAGRCDSLKVGCWCGQRAVCSGVTGALCASAQTSACPSTCGRSGPSRARAPSTTWPPCASLRLAAPSC